MFYRTLLSAIVITCMCTRTSSQATTKDIKKTKDVICILALSGLNRDDLDNKTVNILKRHHVNFDKLRDKNVKQGCLDDLRNRSARRKCEGGNCTTINEEDNLKRDFRVNVTELVTITEPVTTTDINPIKYNFEISDTYSIKYKLETPEPKTPEKLTETPFIYTDDGLYDQDIKSKITELKFEESNIPEKLYGKFNKFTENTEKVFTSRYDSHDADEATTLKYTVNDASTRADNNEQDKTKPNQSSERGGKKHSNLYWPVPKPLLEEEYRKPPDIPINNEEHENNIKNISNLKPHHERRPNDARKRISRLKDNINTIINQENRQRNDQVRESMKEHINNNTIAINQLNKVLDKKYTDTPDKTAAPNNHLSNNQISEIQNQINKLITSQYATLKFLNVTFMRPFLNPPPSVVTTTTAPVRLNQQQPINATANKYNDFKILYSAGLVQGKLDENDETDGLGDTINDLIGITENSSETNKLTNENDMETTVKSIDLSVLDDQSYKLKVSSYSEAFNKKLLRPYFIINDHPERAYENLNTKLKESVVRDEEVDFKSIVEDNDNSTYFRPKTMMLDGNKDEQDSVFKQQSFTQDGAPIKGVFSKNFNSSLTDNSSKNKSDRFVKSRRNALGKNIIKFTTTTTKVVTTPTTTTTTKYERGNSDVKDLNKLMSLNSDFNQEALYNVLKLVEANLKIKKLNNQNASQNNQNIDDSTSDKIINKQKYVEENPKIRETISKNNINTTPAPILNNNNKQYTQNPLVFSDTNLEPNVENPLQFLFRELPLPFIDTSYGSLSKYKYFPENHENIYPNEDRYKILQPPVLNPALVNVEQRRVNQRFEVEANFAPNINQRTPFNNGLYKMQDPPIEFNKYKQNSRLYKNFNNKINYDDVTHVFNYYNQDGGITPTVFFDYSRTPAIKETGTESNLNRILHDACKILRSSSIHTSDSLIKLCQNEFNNQAKTSTTDVYTDDSSQNSDSIQPTPISKLRYIPHSVNNNNEEENMTNIYNSYHYDNYHKEGEIKHNHKDLRVNRNAKNSHRTVHSETGLKEAIAEIKSNSKNGNLNEKDLKKEIVQDILKEIKGYFKSNDENAEPKITKNTDSDGARNEKYVIADNLEQTEKTTSLPPTTTTKTTTIIPMLNEMNHAIANMLKLFNQMQNISPTPNSNSYVKPTQTDTQQEVYKSIQPQVKQHQVFNPQMYQGMNPIISQNLPSYQEPIVINNVPKKTKPITLKNRIITRPLMIQDDAIYVKKIQTNQHFIPPIVQTGDAAFNDRQVIIVATHKPLVKYKLETEIKPTESDPMERDVSSYKRLREERERLNMEEQLSRMVHKSTDIELSSAEKLKRRNRHRYSYITDKEGNSNEGQAAAEIKKRINSKWQQKKHQTEREEKKHKERYSLKPRLQVPLGKKTKGDKNFVNFLKSQQKVNDMLESLLAIRNQERSVDDV